MIAPLALFCAVAQHRETNEEAMPKVLLLALIAMFLTAAGYRKSEKLLPLRKRRPPQLRRRAQPPLKALLQPLPRRAPLVARLHHKFLRIHAQCRFPVVSRGDDDAVKKWGGSGAECIATDESTAQGNLGAFSLRHDSETSYVRTIRC